MPQPKQDLAQTRGASLRGSSKRRRKCFTGPERLPPVIPAVRGYSSTVTPDESQICQLLEAATDADPSIDPKAGAIILRACAEVVTDDPAADAAEVARQCLGRYPHADPSWVAHLARATVSSARATRPARQSS